MRIISPLVPYSLGKDLIIDVSFVMRISEGFLKIQPNILIVCKIQKWLLKVLGPCLKLVWRERKELFWSKESQT